MSTRRPGQARLVGAWCGCGWGAGGYWGFGGFADSGVDRERGGCEARGGVEPVDRGWRVVAAAAGLQNKLLTTPGRRDPLSQAFFQALQQVQAQGMQAAQFNQGQYQFGQNMALQQAQMAQQASQFGASQAAGAASLAEQRREYNLSRKDAQKAAALAGGQAGSSTTPWTAYGMSPTQWRAATTDALSRRTPPRTRVSPSRSSSTS